MYKHKSKRSWHAGKPKKKPDYNPALVTEELLEAVVNVYERLDENGKHPSLQVIVDELDCGLNPIKVRKLFVTAGETQGKKIYQSATAGEALRLWEAGNTVEESVSILGLKFSYMVKGGELLVDRTEKNITRATVELAYQKALEMGGIVKGSKKLGVFGASYLYPVFVRLGVIHPIEK